MSDRFTRDERQSPRREDRELALRVREEMRAAVTNVRAGASAEALAVAEASDDDDRRVEPTPGHVDPHRLH